MEANVGEKRTRTFGDDDDLNLELNPPKMVKRTIYVLQPRPLSNSDLEASPPKLLSLIKSPSTCRSIPENYQKFVRIFNMAWTATQEKYAKPSKEDLELFSWSKSDTLTSLSFNMHSSFIKELLDSPAVTLTEDSYELIDEYIYYVMNRGDANLTDDLVFVDLLSSASNHLRLQTVSLILEYFSKHSRSDLKTKTFPLLWKRLFSFAITKGLNIYCLKGAAGRWFRIFRLYSLNFGPLSAELISSLELDVDRMNLTSMLVQLPRCQPLLAAAAAHNSEAFLDHFNEIESEMKAQQKYLKIVTNAFIWIEMILESDESVSIEIENKSKLGAFANTLYSALTKGSQSFPELITQLFSFDFLHTLQFLIMYSDSARTSIPGKLEQCQLLIPHLKVPEFNFDYIEMVLIVIGFDIRLVDLDTHLVPLFGADCQPILEGLRFLLAVCESAPMNFDPLIPWEIALISPAMTYDTEWPFLLDAGRIMLAKHFSIPPLHTVGLRTENGEEACFRDLAWFMTFYINKLRPDLGPDYAIKLKL